MSEQKTDGWFWDGAQHPWAWFSVPQLVELHYQKVPGAAEELHRRNFEGTRGLPMNTPTPAAPAGGEWEQIYDDEWVSLDEADRRLNALTADLAAARAEAERLRAKAELFDSFFYLRPDGWWLAEGVYGDSKRVNRRISTQISDALQATHEQGGTLE